MTRKFAAFQQARLAAFTARVVPLHLAVNVAFLIGDIPMIETSDLPGANLPDGTAASQNPGPRGSVDGVGAADLKRGYSAESVERTPMFDPDEDGGANRVGDIYTFGGFLGRPQGTAR